MGACLVVHVRGHDRGQGREIRHIRCMVCSLAGHTLAGIPADGAAQLLVSLILVLPSWSVPLSCRFIGVSIRRPEYLKKYYLLVNSRR